MEILFNKISSTRLLERGISCLIYVIFLLYFYKKIKKIDNYKQLNKYLNIYLIILTIMGFLFIPDPSKDLYRWLGLSENWGKLTFGDFISNIAANSTTPIAYIYIYLSRVIGVNGLLPAFCSLVFHYNIFSIIKKTYKKYIFTGESIALSLLFVMCMGRMLEAISGVRSMVAISILANCFITELLNNKIYIKTILYEIIACLIHPLAIVIYAVRLIFVAFQKNNKNIKKMISVIITILLAFILIRIGPDYILATMNKAEGYITNERQYLYIWEYIIASIMWLFTFSALTTSRKALLKEKDQTIVNIAKFSKILLCIALICIAQYSIFHRLMTFTCIISMPIVSYCFYKTKTKFTNNMKVFLILVLMLVVLRGDMCGFTMFRLN